MWVAPLRLLSSLALCTSIPACHRAAADPALTPRVATPRVTDEQPLVRLRVVRLGGGSEQFAVMASGRVQYASDWGSRQLVIAPAAATSLASALVACDLCAIGARPHLPSEASKRRLVVELPAEGASCSTDLPWEAWSRETDAQPCLVAIQRALRPLTDQCAECTLP